MAVVVEGTAANFLAVVGVEGLDVRVLLGRRGEGAFTEARLRVGRFTLVAGRVAAAAAAAAAVLAVVVRFVAVMGCVGLLAPVGGGLGRAKDMVDQEILTDYARSQERERLCLN